MAGQRIGNRMGVAACDIGGGTNKSNLSGGGNNGDSLEHDDTDYATNTALKARLTTIDAGFYTVARLNTLTRNDLIYAVRLNDSPTTIR